MYYVETFPILTWDKFIVTSYWNGTFYQSFFYRIVEKLVFRRKKESIVDVATRVRYSEEFYLSSGTFYCVIWQVLTIQLNISRHINKKKKNTREYIHMSSDFLIYIRMFQLNTSVTKLLSLFLFLLSIRLKI